MFTFPPSLFQSLFPHLAECLARRRAALDAQLVTRRRQARRVRPKLESLEDRLAPAAYTFDGLVSENWSDKDNWNLGQVPGAGDSATITAPCIVDQAASAGDVTVDSSLDITHNLTITANNDLGLTGSLNINPGGSATVKGATLTAVNLGDSGTFTDKSTANISGATTVGTGGTMTIGSDSASDDPVLETGTLSSVNNTTVTIGGPSGGSSGTVDAGGAVGIGGTFNIGGGSIGLLDASNSSVTVAGAGVQLNVGSTDGSTGTLDAYSLTTTGGSSGYNLNVNDKGTINIKHDATLAGNTFVNGGVINAENIDANTGAGVTISGSALVENGPLTGNLDGEVNATFTFTGNSAVTLANGATLGGGTFYIDGPLTVNTPITLSDPEFVLQAGDQPTAGSIGGSGSIDWYNNEFDWQGGTIGGLTGGGFTIEGQADFQTSGSVGKTLSTTLTNIGPSTVDFDGTGALAITGTGKLINDAPYVIPMELSLPLVSGSAPGLFENNGFLKISPNLDNPNLGVTISAPLDNTPLGSIEGETGAGPLTLSDTSGTSTLSGSIDISGSLTISGIYTASALTLDSGGTTLTGTLTLDTGADLGNVILSGSYGGGTINGAGQLETSGYFNWINGSVSCSGGMTVGTDGTLYLMGSGQLSTNLDDEGVVQWENGSSNTIAGGVTVDVDKAALFNFQNGQRKTVTAFNNEGTLEIGSGDLLTVGTFTQTSDGTLQSDIASAVTYGVLDVTGTATLDGTLDGNLVNGYQPPSNTVFDLLNFGSSSGQFATIDPQGWNANYNSNSVDLVSP